MAVKVRCTHPDCGQSFKVAEDLLGGTAVCTKCKRPFVLQPRERDTSAAPSRLDTAAPRSRSVPAKLPGKLGRFEIGEPIGAGAFGAVYRAHDPVLDRDVAIKVPQAATLQSESRKARFLTEAKAAARLQHPNIVPVFEAGHDGDSYYLVSAFIAGQTLEAAMEERKFEFHAGAKLVMDLAGALYYAHRRGIVHRDIKPANIMLDAQGDPLLMDFGLARLDAAVSKLTHDGTVLGTPAYMPPEQAAGRLGQVGPASDQYSLGAVLYELLCGSAPFSGPPTLVISLVINQEPPSPRSVNPSLPKDLETICLKAMAKRPEQRYTDCQAFAEDLRRLCAGEPITARRVNPAERFTRWCKRNPVVAGLSTTAAMLLLLVTVVSSVAYARVVRSQRERIFAQVESLRRADIAQVPYLLESLAPAYNEIAPRLKELLQQPDLTENEHLRLSLALLADDPKQVEYLQDCLLNAAPPELPVIRTALLPHRERLAPKMWRVVDDAQSSKDRRFRAACALAEFDPEGAGWAKAAQPTADVLVTDNPLYAVFWTEALRPVAKKLLPPLAQVLQDAKRSESELAVTVGILADYAAQEPEILVELIRSADDAKQFATLLPKLQSHGAKAAALLETDLDKDIPHEAAGREKENHAKGKANAAAALLRMNRSDKVWPLLKHTPDPTARAYLIHRVASRGVDAKILVNRIDQEHDTSVRRALLLSLGEYDEHSLSNGDRQRLISMFFKQFKDDPDAGIHGAIYWLLRKWGEGEQLKRIEEELAGATTESEQNWYVSPHGHTMAIVRGPVEFLMGSPSNEVGRSTDEVQHRRRIGRSFAIATSSLTVGQYLREVGDADFAEEWREAGLSPDHPVLMQTWYEAATFCNRLSLVEGIPRSQLCYMPNPSGGVRNGYTEGMRPAPDFLNRTGYRLPTEAEWEYACRAGAVTSRFYGETAELLPSYAWYHENSQVQNWPVRSLKPNDLGLFDMYGNGLQWCNDVATPLPNGIADDLADETAVNDQIARVLRGQGFEASAAAVRSASRYAFYPTVRSSNIGLRLVRTVREHPSNASDRQSQEHATDSWVAVEIPDVDYKLRFPAMPKKDVQDLDFVGGQKARRTIYSVQTNREEVIFYFAFTEIPPGAVRAALRDVEIDTLLDGIRNNQLHEVGGKLQDERKVTVDGNRGRFYAFKGTTDGKAAIFHVQSWIAGDRVFQATVNGTDGYFNPADAKKFLASIRPL